MRRNKTKKTKLVVILLILVLLISVGYAALSTQLQITGNATIKKQGWNIYFNNVQVKTGSVTGAKVVTAPSTSGTSTTTLTWEVSLDTPGEFYEFNVDVVNSGNIDAMVSTATNSIVTSTLTAAQREYLDYTITYVNGAAVEQYDKLEAGETKTLTIKLLFKQDIDPEDLPATAQNSISLNYTANYVQADGNAVEKVTTVAQADPLEIGDPVAYSTTLNNVTINNWRVFYIDETNDLVYIISDYLPNAALTSSFMSTNNLTTGDGSYNVDESNIYSITSAAAPNSYWDNLLTGTMGGQQLQRTRENGVLAMGSPTLTLWKDSWNATHSNPANQLYFITDEIMDGNPGDMGYEVGVGGTSYTYDLDLTSISNGDPESLTSLYFPHSFNFDSENCNGYWIAAQSVMDPGAPLWATQYGINSNFVNVGACYRPVICFSYSDVVKAQS